MHLRIKYKNIEESTQEKFTIIISHVTCVHGLFNLKGYQYEKIS